MLEARIDCRQRSGPCALGHCQSPTGPRDLIARGGTLTMVVGVAIMAAAKDHSKTCALFMRLSCIERSIEKSKIAQRLV